MVPLRSKFLGIVMVDYIAFCAAVCSASISIPQFILVVRTKVTHGLSLTMWVLSLGTGIGWLCHGFKLGVINMIWPNFWILFVVVTILYFLRRNGRYRSVVKLLPGIALAALLVGLDNFVGSAAFGAAVIVPQVYGMMRQGLSLMRSPLVTGVSTGAWVLMVINHALWLTWAIMSQEIGTMISGAVCVGPAIFVLTWCILRARGVGPVGSGKGAETDAEPETSTVEA